MISCGIRLCDSSWSSWLPALSGSSRLDGFECDLGNFNSPSFVQSASNLHLRCLHGRDLLPGDSSAILAHAIERDSLGLLRRHLFDAMVYASALETNVFSLQLRLDRYSAADFPAQAQQLASFFQSLLAAPLDTPYVLALQVRQPPAFPKSEEWQRALRLCELANSKRIGICLHFYADDLLQESCQSPTALLDEVGDKLQILCFHYNPAVGETLYDDEQQEWAALLLQRNYQGLVMFCPETNENSDPAALCQEAESWADFYKHLF